MPRGLRRWSLTGDNLCRFMMSAARRCDLPPRSGGQHLPAKVALPHGRQPPGRRGPGCWKQPPILSSCVGQAGRQDVDLVEMDLGLCACSQGPRSCTAKTGGSIVCISKLGATLASLSPTYLRSLKRQHRGHQLSFLSQEHPGSWPLCRLPSP